jgi:hypothetical protein
VAAAGTYRSLRKRKTLSGLDWSLVDGSDLSGARIAALFGGPSGRHSLILCEETLAQSPQPTIASFFLLRIRTIAS